MPDPLLQSAAPFALGDIFHADLASVGDLAPRKRGSVLENEILNISRPLIREGE
jgi:hypothetical protein